MSPYPARATYTAYIGIGSNMGDRRALIQKALDLIKEIPDTAVVRESDFLEFEAEGVPMPQPKYLNGVIGVETELLPLELLEKLQIIERKLGRETKGDLSPRPIDLDLLSYGPEVIVKGRSIVLPHPHLHERRFVLQALVQIDPDWVHPRIGKTARELLAELGQASSNEDHSFPKGA